jgi:Malectin domain
MDVRRVSLAFAVCCAAAAAKPAIKIKAPPVVNAGSTFQFAADRPVTWSMAPGSKGRIDPDGTYHAPARFEAKQSLAGCQLLPNNHVFNVRVDNLPVHPKSDLWMNARDPAGRKASQGSVNYLPAVFPVNIMTSALEPQKMVFAYTPQYNGTFRVPPATEMKIESGAQTPPFGGTDRHLIALEKDTCIIQEMYNLYPAGTNTQRNCPACTSQSGVRYPSLTYALPSGATDAAGMYLSPLSLHRDEILSGTIQHALRVTVGGTFVRNTAVWPATAAAGYNRSDTPPFGTRVRLKSQFVSPSTNPYTQTLVKQLKEYGLIIADIGAPWQSSLEDVDLYYDPQIIAAFQEVAKTVSAANLEVVDESGLMVNARSGETSSDAETVIATDASDKSTAMVHVILAGITIGTDAQFLSFQAGAQPHPLTAWVNGVADKGVTWEMSAPVGTVSPTGVYTPPANVSKLEKFTITAKAHADANVKTSIAMTVLPAGTIRIDSGSATPYTDSSGNVWLPTCCTPSAKSYSYGSGGFPKVPDVKLYEDVSADWNDIPYVIYMKPGQYRITVKVAECSVNSPGKRTMNLESQGQTVYRNVDLFTMAGPKTPIDFDLPATVGPDGRLQFWVRHVTGEVTYIGALEIAPDPGTKRVQLIPANGGTLVPMEKRQFQIVRWFLPNEEFQWSISPQVGTIDQNGVYTAPSTPVSEDTPVTITARGARDPNFSARSVVTIKKGIPTVRINSGGGQFTDAQGNVWAGDQGFKGGVTFRQPSAIAGATPDMQPLYQASRYAYGNQSFSYAFHLPNGKYHVTLKWAEYRTAAQVEAQKIAYKMNVAINGQVVLKDFDLIAAAGGAQKAIDKQFDTEVSNSLLNIVFAGQPGAGYVGAAVNGIEIQPAQ